MSGQEWVTLTTFAVAMIGLSFLSREAALYITAAVGIVILIRSGVLNGLAGQPPTNPGTVGGKRL